MSEMLMQQFSLSNVYQDKFSYTAERVYLEETTSAGKSLILWWGLVYMTLTAKIHILVLI